MVEAIEEITMVRATSSGQTLASWYVQFVSRLSAFVKEAVPKQLDAPRKKYGREALLSYHNYPAFFHESLPHQFVLE
jgi:hypothetical protein